MKCLQVPTVHQLLNGVAFSFPSHMILKLWILDFAILEKKLMSCIKNGVILVLLCVKFLNSSVNLVKGALFERDFYD